MPSRPAALRPPPAHPIAAAAASLLLSLLLSLAASAAGAQPPPPQPPDPARLARWFAGEFDNFQQVFEQLEAKSPAPHQRIHAVVTPIALPALGDHAFLLRLHPDDDPARIAAVRIYGLGVSTADGAVRMRAFAVTDPQAFTEAAPALAALTAAGAPALRPLPGCDILWRAESDAYAGATPAGGCRDQPAAAPGAAAATFRLTADELSIGDGVTEAEGTAARETPGRVPHRLRRARPFTCWAALRKEGAADQYDGLRNLALHDQGRMVPIAVTPGQPARYSFELSQLRYSQQLPVLKLAVYERGNDVAVAYTWTEPDGQRIGINLRWVQVGCTIALER